ncbi:hypothetical protein ACWKWK_12780 [Pseudoxanthomonas beigongshangi]
MKSKKILFSIAAVLFGLLAVNCVVGLAITIYFKRAFTPELAALVCLIVFFSGLAKYTWGLARAG